MLDGSKKTAIVLAFITLSFLAIFSTIVFVRGLFAFRLTISTANDLSIADIEPFLSSMAYEHIKNTQVVPLLPHKKLILLLVDGIREDFVAMPFEYRIPSSAYSYKGKTLSLFNEKMVQEPDNTRLFSLRTNTPTFTSHRVKGIATGTLPTFLDFGENASVGRINSSSPSSNSFYTAEEDSFVR